MTSLLAKVTGRAKGRVKYRMPDESAPHLRTFMQWPSSRVVYTHEGDLEAMQESIALIARTIAQFEPVVMLGRAEHARQIDEWAGGNAEHWEMPTEDLWCRDAQRRSYRRGGRRHPLRHPATAEKPVIAPFMF
ncbi:MAG: agmatine deiminase family protein [Sphingorhabdus sp.]